jgi:hypothetical protein
LFMTISPNSACTCIFEDTKEKGLQLCSCRPLLFWCGWQELNPLPLGS